MTVEVIGLKDLDGFRLQLDHLLLDICIASIIKQQLLVRLTLLELISNFHHENYKPLVLLRI